MSFLRYSRPGVPGYTAVDLGPSHAATGTRIGGTLVQGRSGASISTPRDRATQKARRAELCGARVKGWWLRCAHARGHEGPHATSEQVREST